MKETHSFVRYLNDQGIVTCSRCGILQVLADEMTCDERVQRLEREDRALAKAGHVTDGSPCWCDPSVEEVDGAEVVIHRDPAKAS